MYARHVEALMDWLPDLGDWELQVGSITDLLGLLVGLAVFAFTIWVARRQIKIMNRQTSISEEQARLSQQQLELGHQQMAVAHEQTLLAKEQGLIAKRQAEIVETQFTIQEITLGRKAEIEVSPDFPLDDNEFGLQITVKNRGVAPITITHANVGMRVGSYSFVPSMPENVKVSHKKTYMSGALAERTIYIIHRTSVVPANATHVLLEGSVKCEGAPSDTAIYVDWAVMTKHKVFKSTAETALKIPIEVFGLSES